MAKGYEIKCICRSCGTADSVIARYEYWFIDGEDTSAPQTGELVVAVEETDTPAQRDAKCVAAIEAHLGIA